MMRFQPVLVFLALSLPFAGGQEKAEVFASYATLKTVAGLGEDEDSNFWKPTFEGMLATQIELSNPHMTMADAAGNLYVADKESHSILRIDREGRIHSHAGTHEAGFNGEEGLATAIQLDNPNGLFVRPNGVVYILDFFNQRVRRVDRQGQLTTLLHDPDGFGPGRGLWVSPSEDLIYLNGPNAIKRWTPDTGVEVLVSSISDPGNLTVDPDGNLVVTSRTGETGHRVYRVDPAGELMVIAGNGTTDEPSVGGVPATSIGLESARSIAFLPGGGFFLATQKGGDIWYVDPEGLIHRFISGAPRGNVRNGDGALFSTPGDKIAEPRAIALAPNGDLIITTNDTGYVRIVERFQMPHVTEITPDRVTWEVIKGRAYHVETSADLRTWTTQQSASKQSTSVTLTDPLKGQSYYRLAW